MSQFKKQSDTYQCAMCKRIYAKSISDGEAMAEAQSYWPGVTQQDCATVCDDCWQKIHPDQHPVEYEQSVAELAIQQALTALQNTDNPSDVLLLLGTIQQQIVEASGIPPALLGIIDTNHTARISKHNKDAYEKRFRDRKKR